MKLKVFLVHDGMLLAENMQERMRRACTLLKRIKLFVARGISL